MADSGWIDVRDRMPAESDADRSGRVLVWHAMNGVMVTGWWRLEENCYITHWMHTPGKPEGVRSVPELEHSRAYT